MHHTSLSTFADRPIRLQAANFGSPCLKVNEAPEHKACVDHCVASVHDAAPNTEAGMDRLTRAVAAFNAIMDGAEVLPVHMPTIGVDRTELRREANRPAAERDDEAASDMVEADEELAF